VVVFFFAVARTPVEKPLGSRKKPHRWRGEPTGEDSIGVDDVLSPRFETVQGETSVGPKKALSLPSGKRQRGICEGIGQIACDDVDSGQFGRAIDVKNFALDSSVRVGPSRAWIEIGNRGNVIQRMDGALRNARTIRRYRMAVGLHAFRCRQ
jgi:hypothetical protein